MSSARNSLDIPINDLLGYILCGPGWACESENRDALHVGRPFSLLFLSGLRCDRSPFFQHVVPFVPVVSESFIASLGFPVGRAADIS